MITGLTKKQKTTSIFFDEHSNTIEILTHNTDLKKRLTKYAAEHPDLYRQTDDDGQGGLEFEIEKGRFSIRLIAPYREERRKKASKNAKEKGIQIRKEGKRHAKTHLCREKRPLVRVARGLLSSVPDRAARRKASCRRVGSAAPALSPATSYGAVYRAKDGRQAEQLSGRSEQSGGGDVHPAG